MVKYVALTVGLVFAIRLAHRGPDTNAPHVAANYSGTVTFATTGNGDPFHPSVVQDLDLASGQFTVRFDGLDAARTRSGEMAFVQRLAPGTYADHGIVVVTDRRGGEVARFEGYNAPEWLPNRRLVMMGTQCRRGGIYLTDASVRSMARIDGDQVNTPASAPAASPDGSTLAFVWNSQLWALALFRPGDQKSVVFRDLGVYPYGPITWR